MTQAINILPNLYTRLAQIGLFRFEGVSQRSVITDNGTWIEFVMPSWADETGKRAKPGVAPVLPNPLPRTRREGIDRTAALMGDPAPGRRV